MALTRVSGNLIASGVSLTFDAGNAAFPALTTTGDTNTGIFFPAADTIAFTEGGAESMRVDSSGNLGVGTTSPFNANGKNIEVANSTVARIVLNQTGTRKMSIGVGSNVLNIYDETADAERMRLDSGGNLGLGVTPSAWNSAYKALQFSTTGSLYGEVGEAAVYLGCNVYVDSVGNKYTTTDFATQYSQENGVHKWLTAASGTAGNAITFTEIMRGVSVNTNNIGNGLLIGTTAFTQAGSVTKVVVADNLSTAYGLGIVASNTGQSYFTQFVVNGSGVGGITSNGTTTAYNTTSDYRLKNVTGALTGYKERLMSLQPKQGTWKSNGSEFRGFLAHEFAEPYSESVTGEKDAVDANGKPKMQSMQASSSEVIADLVAHIQNLETRLSALEGN